MHGFFQLLCRLVSFYFIGRVSDLPIVYFKTVSFFLSFWWFASCNEVNNTCLWKVFFFLSSLETKLARASSQRKLSQLCVSVCLTEAIWTIINESLQYYPSPERSAESFIVLWNPHIIFSKISGSLWAKCNLFAFLLSCGMQDGPDLHRSSPGEDNYFFDWRHCFVWISKNSFIL